MIEIFHEYKKAELGISATNCHIAGHSLGAHLAGYAGQQLQQCGHKLGRITGESTSSAHVGTSSILHVNASFFFDSGLDPADPYFQNTEAMIRLDASDAHFVDVIHTNGGPILSGGASISINSFNPLQFPSNIT